MVENQKLEHCEFCRAQYKRGPNWVRGRDYTPYDSTSNRVFEPVYKIPEDVCPFCGHHESYQMPVTSAM